MLNGEVLIEKVCDYLGTRSEVQVGYLFGSQVSGRATGLSDIDIAILVDETSMERHYPYGYKARVCTELMKLLRTNRVDLVVLNEAPYFLRHRVVSLGRPVYVRNEAQRIYFEANTMGRYPDLKRLLAVHVSS